MRLSLTLSGGQPNIPFSYQHELIRAFHRHLPDNAVHDDISLYSLGWLRGGTMRNDSLIFPRGALWDVTFYHDCLAKQFLVGILKDKSIAFDMKIVDVQIVEPPEFGEKTKFILQSPILLKEYDAIEKKGRLVIYSEPQANMVMTGTMKSKLRKANLPDDIRLSFDKDYFPKAKTKLVEIKGIKNKASFCPVIAEGTPEQLQFAWSVGLGNSTGSGFGAVC